MFFYLIGFSKPSRRKSSGEPLQSLVKRDIQDYVLNLHSDFIHIIYKDQDTTAEFDIFATLIEIDMQSICSLLSNFRDIISSGGRNLSPKDIIVILDTMINDVRRLSSRSPTLFRLATRSTIAKSKDTRYGVDYGNVFATMTTSEGIRIFIEKSVAYYLSLPANSADEETVRPKFLQMLVMLLALLNDQDLKIISGLLETTFKIPGDREGIELLILKVLPLASINSKVFMEDLLEACNYRVGNVALEEPKQQLEQWQRLQQDFAEKGYIFPVPTKQIVPMEEFEDDLEALMDQQELNDHDSEAFTRQPTDVPMGIIPTASLISQYPKSWMAPWPEYNGIRDSTIFRHIQHCEKLRKEGNFQQETIRAINHIPHLDVTSEDREDEYLAIFVNGARFRVRSADPDNISAMKKDKYTLKEIESNSIVDLDIETDLLNGPFIELTKQHNYLVDRISEFLGSRRERRRSLLLNRPSPTTFTRIQEPIEAMRVWADLVPRSGQSQRCAEAFKLGDRIVFREDILRNMNDVLSRVKSSVQRIEKAIPGYRIRTSDEEIRRMQEAHISALIASLENIESLQNEALRKRSELINQSDTSLPSDPILSIVYTSFIGTSGEKPEWQPYVSRLHSDRERLIVQAKKFVVDNVLEDEILKLEFCRSRLTLAVQPLRSSTSTPKDEDHSSILKDDIVLWLGYYVVHIEPHISLRNSFTVQAYYKVLSQKQERISQAYQSSIEKPQLFVLV